MATVMIKHVTTAAPGRIQYRKTHPTGMKRRTLLTTSPRPGSPQSRRQSNELGGMRDGRGADSRVTEATMNKTATVRTACRRRRPRDVGV
jgi:hypothetical protein